MVLFLSFLSSFPSFKLHFHLKSHFILFYFSVFLAIKTYFLTWQKPRNIFTSPSLSPSLPLPLPPFQRDKKRRKEKKNKKEVRPGTFFLSILLSPFSLLNGLHSLILLLLLLLIGVLVHCREGLSRSPSILLSYLMVRRGIYIRFQCVVYSFTYYNITTIIIIIGLSLSDALSALCAEEGEREQIEEKEGEGEEKEGPEGENKENEENKGKGKGGKKEAGKTTKKKRNYQPRLNEVLFFAFAFVIFMFYVLRIFLHFSLPDKLLFSFLFS